METTMEATIFGVQELALGLRNLLLQDKLWDKLYSVTPP